MLTSPSGNLMLEKEFSPKQSYGISVISAGITNSPWNRHRRKALLPIFFRLLGRVKVPPKPSPSRLSGSNALPPISTTPSGITKSPLMPHKPLKQLLGIIFNLPGITKFPDNIEQSLKQESPILSKLSGKESSPESEEQSEKTLPPKTLRP